MAEFGSLAPEIPDDVAQAPQRLMDVDWSRLNQPTGEASVYTPSPSERVGNVLQDAMIGAGAQPYVAGHLAHGLRDVAALSPLGVPMAAADFTHDYGHGNLLDAGSRGLDASQASRNRVLFTDQPVKVLRRYALPGMLTGTALMSQRDEER